MRRLGDLIDIRGGLSYKSKFIDSGDAKLLGMGCVSFSQRFLQGGCRSYEGDYTEKHLVEEGDLVIATRQQSENLPILGFPAMIPSGMNGTDIIVGTNLYKVNNQSNFANSFLFWLMRGEGYRSHVKACASGSTVRMITKDVILDYCFACPAEKEAEAIATFLDRIEDKIELNQKMNQTLEEIAKAIFKSWFVDFDPVRAKAEGRPTGLPPEISDLFPDELVDSEIGEIPKGWEVKTISDLADCLGGATPSTKNSDFWDGGHLTWTSPKDLSKLESIHLLKTARKITESGLKKISSGLLPVGTVLLSSRAPVGYLALTTEPTAINQGYIALKPVSGVSNYFLLNWCDSNLEQIKNRASGTTFAEISKAAFRPIPAVSPSRELMTKFHEFVEPIYERVLCASKEVETLSELRDTLLPKLISGELCIPDAEKFLEEAGI